MIVIIITGMIIIAKNIEATTSHISKDATLPQPYLSVYGHNSFYCQWRYTSTLEDILHMMDILMQEKEGPEGLDRKTFKIQTRYESVAINENLELVILYVSVLVIDCY
jgi:hypothetical protein